MRKVLYLGCPISRYDGDPASLVDQWRAQPTWNAAAWQMHVTTYAGDSSLDAESFASRVLQSNGPVLLLKPVQHNALTAIQKRISLRVPIFVEEVGDLTQLSQAIGRALTSFENGEPTVPRDVAVALMLMHKLDANHMWAGNAKGYMWSDDLPKGRRIGFFPGSTIGNLEPAEAVRFLTSAKGLLGEDALFILGVDLVKAPEILVAAYDDVSGVTAAFNRNLLVRANAELGADFDLDAFRHRAVWNAEKSRMEMHLEAVRPTVAHIQGRRFEFAAGETLHTENSRKFTEAAVTDMAEAAGWRVVRFDVSPAPSVALVLMSA